MKRLILLTAIAILTVGASGCRSCDWFRRGAPAQAVALPPPGYCDPCATTAAPCDACAPTGAMMVAPGPEAYAPVVPGPGR